MIVTAHCSIAPNRENDFGFSVLCSKVVGGHGSIPGRGKLFCYLIFYYYCYYCCFVVFVDVLVLLFLLYFPYLVKPRVIDISVENGHNSIILDMLYLDIVTCKYGIKLSHVRVVTVTYAKR